MLNNIIKNGINNLIKKEEYSHNTKIFAIKGDNRQQIQLMFMNTTHIITELEKIITNMNLTQKNIQKNIDSIKEILKSQKLTLSAIILDSRPIIMKELIEQSRHHLSECKIVFNFLENKASTNKGKNKKQLTNSKLQYLNLKSHYNNIRKINDFINLLKKDLYNNINIIKTNKNKNNDINNLFDCNQESDNKLNIEIPDISNQKIIENISEILKTEYNIIKLMCIQILIETFSENKKQLYKLYVLIESYYNQKEEIYEYDDDLDFM